VLGTSSVAEAVELRTAGITAPIVVLGGVFPGEEGDVAKHDLAAGVWSLDRARAIAAGAERPHRPPASQGRHRHDALGFDLPDVAGAAAALRDIQGVTLDGLYSHFATSRRGRDRARAGADRAVSARPLPSLGRRCRISTGKQRRRHLAAPAHFTLVRPGLMLYGCSPAPHLAERAALRPALRFRTAVAQVRRVPPGRAVGYGGTYVTSRASVIATCRSLCGRLASSGVEPRLDARPRARVRRSPAACAWITRCST
jgi:alanine racemase